VNGALVTPTSTRVNMVDTLTGPTIGVSGFVFASEIKFSLGFGTSLASMGSYGKVTVSTGLAVGSSAGLGGPTEPCKQVTSVITGSAGIGTEVSSGAVDVLKKLIGNKVKGEYEVQAYSHDFYGPYTDYYPRINLCKAF